MHNKPRGRVDDELAKNMAKLLNRGNEAKSYSSEESSKQKMLVDIEMDADSDLEDFDQEVQKEVIA